MCKEDRTLSAYPSHQDARGADRRQAVPSWPHLAAVMALGFATGGAMALIGWLILLRLSG